MSRIGLFGHLATQFATSPENLATESLNYILQSPTARRAMVTFLGQAAGVELDERYTFRTQVGGTDAAVPDLVGFDSNGDQSLIIEAKFWAGLTDNQPVGYFNRLPAGNSGALVFLAPADRLDLLWRELLRRCQSAALDVRTRSAPLAETRCAAVGRPSHSLVLLSWRRLLTFLEQELDAAREDDVAADVAQLQGLCDRMDSEAFLPVRSEDLTSELPWRLLQYAALIEDLTNALVAKGLVSVAGRRANHGFVWFGRTMDVGEHLVFIGFSADNWAELEATPLWMSVHGRNWAVPPASVQNALSPLEVAEPSRLHVLQGHLAIPLFIPTGVEHDEVLSSLEVQVREVIALLPAS